MKREFLEKALENDIRTDMLSYIDWHDLSHKNICDGVFGHEFDYEDLDEIIDKKNTYNEFVGIDKIETRESIIEQTEKIKKEKLSFKHIIQITMLFTIVPFKIIHVSLTKR